MKTIVFSIPLLLSLLLPSGIKADSANQFINIVNPVRISASIKDPASSLDAEYLEIKKRNLPATWLLTYDVIINQNMVLAAKKMDQSQELGIFLEVTPKFAEDAGVIYRKTDSWHRANSIFLSGYTQADRKKMIDTVFQKFKETFGFYPTSVGSWWNDSFSLEYMKDKYGITANLTCADQFKTDGYHIWGQYWSTPFYPSKYHAGIPARDANSKLDLVTIQWAARDPLNGYESSAYSVQDYFTFGFGRDYFEKLIKLYAEKHGTFGQITVGLEGDLTADAYKGTFASQIQFVSELQKNGNYNIITMQNFSNWYRSQFKDGTPDSLIESDDLMNKGQKAIWYQSPNYRIGMAYDKKESKLVIFDLRTYFSNFQEPYYVSPNFQIDLFINIPSVIDSISNPQSKWEIHGLKLKSIDKKVGGYDINFEGDKLISLTQNSINFNNFGQEFKPSIFIKNSPKLRFERSNGSFIIYPESVYRYSNSGFSFADLSIDASYFLWRPKMQLMSKIFISVIVVISFLILFLLKKRTAKFKLLGVVYLPILVIGASLFLANLQSYSVGQSEIDALDYLAALPFGKVAVQENGCLICKWQTKYPPPAFAGKKNYVSQLSHKPIIYNSSVFLAQTRQGGRRELNKLGVKYIYLVRYGGYVEEMPFSPGDLNVEKIYENANTQIWQVKN